MQESLHSIIMSPLFERYKWGDMSLTSANVRHLLNTHQDTMSYEEVLRANGVYATLWMKENGHGIA